jgi:septum site-determining protein MinC
MASVSPGAELLAEGNIHVYGTLRGRALAGVNGNTQARIFCQKLEAELVSIAGHYRVLEDNVLTEHPGMKQIYLDDSQLIIRPL